MYVILQEYFLKKQIFKPWGLANNSHTDEEGLKFVSYQDALAANGHDNTTLIHYLKIDIEQAEFPVRNQ